jgi:hypothetical protein
MGRRVFAANEYGASRRSTGSILSDTGNSAVNIDCRNVWQIATACQGRGLDFDATELIAMVGNVGLFDGGRQRREQLEAYRTLMKSSTSVANSARKPA